MAFVTGSSKAKAGHEYPQHSFLMPVEDLFRAHSTSSDTGLTALKANEAQQTCGPTKLEGEGAIQWYSVLLKQISNAMIIVGLEIGYPLLRLNPFLFSLNI